MAFYEEWGITCLAATAIIAFTFFTKHILTKQEAQPASLRHSPPNTKRSAVSAALAEALPDSVFFSSHPAFLESIQSYWAMQERDIVPQCIVRPYNVQEVSTTVAILHDDFNTRIREGSKPSPFAVRGGGHSPLPGASNIERGIVVDMSHFNQVVPSEDEFSVVIGAGCRWQDVSRILDDKGLAVAGGRDSAVGVAGLTLGGGISYFSPRIGFVCSNVLSYEVILADGIVTTASESKNSGLWRALKGGANNFGIVTSFLVRSFPSSKVWSGFLYMKASKTSQVMQALHNFTKATPGESDEYAAGPFIAFSYVQRLGLQAIAVNLVYTKPQKWPACFRGFQNIGRLWSAMKVRSLTGATDNLHSYSPAGWRQLWVTTTVKNDYDTLIKTHAIYEKCISDVRRVQGLIWTLTVQPLLPTMMSRGQPNSLGLDSRDESLIVVIFSATWKKATDDKLINQTARAATEEIDAYAMSKGTADPFRYLNDCAGWQAPFDGAGADNKRFLQKMSKTHDPEGLFQRACVGGFKLDMYKSEPRINEDERST